MKNLIWITSLLLSLTLVVVGCSQSQFDEIKAVPIGDILSHPDIYKGESVVVKGKIVTECDAGCWFTLDDGTGTIYVDLAPSNLVIPPKVGAKAVVTGLVVVMGSDIYLIGKKVSF